MCATAMSKEIVLHYLNLLVSVACASRKDPPCNMGKINQMVLILLFQKLSTNFEEEEETGFTYSEPYVSNGRQPAVKISNLRTVYPGRKVAVESLSLEIFDDQITALLGHNGAGKSTTISMLTGLIRPTGGDAFIWGHSIRNNMNDIRRFSHFDYCFFPKCQQA